MFSRSMMFGAALACAGGGADVARAELIYGITNEQSLVSWDSATPGTLISGTSISGLQTNEVIQGIDLRPSTGQVYALGSFNRLYTLNLITGAATQVGGVFSVPLNGSNFGFDFNPMIDRIRVVSNTNNNYVLDPNTGQVQGVATNVFFAAGDANQLMDPNLGHAAYSNNFAGATSTQLYAIDTGLDVLVRQSNSAGMLNTVGSIASDATELGAFDISGASNIGYAVLRNNSEIRTTFCTFNLTTGAATTLGEVGGGAIITAMTVVPTPGSLGLLGAGLLVIASRRRA